MLDESPVTGTLNDDAPSARRSADPGCPLWLAEFLERRRTEPRFGFADWQGQEEYQRHRARIDAAWDVVEQRLSVSTEEEQRSAVVALLTADGLDSTDAWRAREGVTPLVALLDGWTPEEVEALLRRACADASRPLAARDLGLALDAAERLDADGCRAVAAWVRHARGEVAALEADARRRGRLTARLDALLGRVEEAVIPAGLIPAYDVWAAALREQAGRAATPELAAFLRHMTGLSGPRPTQRWRRACTELADAASARDLAAEVLRSLAEDEPLCSKERGAHADWMGEGSHYHFLVHQDDRDLARGLIWTSALTGGPATVAHLVALALRVGLHSGGGVIADLKLAGAAINALAEVEDASALAALWRLRSRIRDRALRKQVDTALTTAAARAGITPASSSSAAYPTTGWPLTARRSGRSRAATASGWRSRTARRSA
ncbi:hypothetical protein [Streptacidiphilus melanogenes]|uniref:hypothetical protein n=1 Tax=Streptacidiphilus melanogenes TaxID=411235 RepID=UPI0006939B77|nr:hypothetical protein [Streptacidiphilus melanogenes]